MTSIDLNCDLGEGCGNDAELMRHISSANIACGFHAGNEATMRRTVELAVKNGVAVGAHPGYRDPENFGRTEMSPTRDEVRRLIRDQLDALQAVCEEFGTRIGHIKPHGALYNQAARDRELASAIAETVAEWDARLILYGRSGSVSISEAQMLGLETASEVFADRTYQSDGSLTPRSQSGALIFEIETSLNQVLDMIKYGRVRSVDAIIVPIECETICIHGDGPNAVEVARLINERLTSEGIQIARPNGQLTTLN